MTKHNKVWHDMVWQKGYTVVENGYEVRTYFNSQGDGRIEVWDLRLDNPHAPSSRCFQAATSKRNMLRMFSILTDFLGRNDIDGMFRAMDEMGIASPEPAPRSPSDYTAHPQYGRF